MSRITVSNNYELSLPPKREFRNAKNGRFLKGHVPANKGKKWSEYMGKRAQKRAAKGWKNLDKHRPRTRPDTEGRCRRQVIAIMDDGAWKCYSSIGSAAESLGANRSNISRCCRDNQSRRNLKDTLGRPSNKVNTDHKHMGIRFYFENDNIWTTKINL